MLIRPAPFTAEMLAWWNTLGPRADFAQLVKRLRGELVTLPSGVKYRDRRSAR